MAPGGKAFIIFNFPPGVSFLQRTSSVSSLRPGQQRPSAMRRCFLRSWLFASRAVIDLKATATATAFHVS
jgi:hypothetical protein